MELFASVRPCSVTVSFNFRFLDGVSGKEAAFPFVVLALLLSPGDSSSEAGKLSEAIFELSACAELGRVIYYLSRDG